MGSDLSPRFDACSFYQNQGRGKYQWFLIHVLSAHVLIIYILFPVSIWCPFKAAAQCSASVAWRWSNFRRGKQGGEKLLRFVAASVNPAEVSGALLCARVYWCAGAVAVRVTGTGLSFLCAGGPGQWPRPGWWITAWTRPAISHTVLGKRATCPASSHLTDLFLSGKGYELCSFFSGTSCPLEIPEGWGAVRAAPGTLLWGPRPGIFTQHQALKPRLSVRYTWTKLPGSMADTHDDTHDVIWAASYHVPKESSGNCYWTKKQVLALLSLCCPHLHLVTVTHAVLVSSEALGLEGSMIAQYTSFCGEGEGKATLPETYFPLGSAGKGAHHFISPLQRCVCVGNWREWSYL